MLTIILTTKTQKDSTSLPHMIIKRLPLVPLYALYHQSEQSLYTTTSLVRDSVSECTEANGNQ